MFAPGSPQPSAQLRRIPCPMPDGADDDLQGFPYDREIHRIWPRFWQRGLPRQAGRARKSFRILANYFEESVQFAGKSLPHSRFARVVKIHRFSKFLFRLRFNDHPKRHHLVRNRFSMSAITSSSGRHRSGCASACAARRSNSAICSGVKSGSTHPSSSPYSCHTCSTNARFSSVGIGRICSMRSVAVMAGICRVERNAQMQIRPSSFAFRHSP